MAAVTHHWAKKNNRKHPLIDAKLGMLGVELPFAAAGIYGLRKPKSSIARAMFKPGRLDRWVAESLVRNR